MDLVPARLQFSNLTAKQAYDILVAFRDSFLAPEEQRESASTRQRIWQERQPALALVGHDQLLDALIGVLAIPAARYQPGAMLDLRPISQGMGIEQSQVLMAAWEIIDNATKTGDTTAKKIAQHLRLAVGTLQS